MFLGEYTHTIDDKGRLTIPAKFRAELASGMVVTRGFDNNLMVYPLGEWEKLAQEILQKPQTEARIREFRRRVFSGAVDVEPDRQGRILVPPYLREFAGLENEVVLVGMFNYIEVWHTAVWTTVRQQIENNDDTARWADLGI
jgi:MraZ protein